MKIVAHIPARAGSERVKRKNLTIVNKRPLIEWAIMASLKSQKLDEIYVNSESEEIGEVGLKNKVKWFQREPHLAQSDVVNSEFNYDFAKKVPSDIFLMINPVCPLIEGEDIDRALEHFLSSGKDSLITVSEEKLHSFLDGKSLNFDASKNLTKSQDNKVIQVCNWAITIYKTDKFIEEYEKNGHAAFCGDYELFPIDPYKGKKISEPTDILEAEALLSYFKK